MPNNKEIRIDLSNISKFIFNFWKYLPYILMLLIFYLAYNIRKLPLKNMQFLQALDPYWISRMSATYLWHGTMPPIDFLRSFPFTAPTTSHYFAAESYIPAFIFKIFGPLFSLNFLQWAQIYPAIVASLMVVATFFIGKEMMDKWTGVFSAFFTATIVAILHRSSAGWFEKEATAGFLMLFSIYFFIRALKRKSWLSGILSGLSGGIAWSSWGGAQYIFLLYPLTTAILLLLNENIEEMLIAFTPSSLIGTFFVMIFQGSVNFTSPLFLLQISVLIPLWLRYLAEKYRWVEKEKLRLIPWAFFIFIGLFSFLSPLYSQELAFKVNSLKMMLFKAGTAGVIGRTVAENSPADISQIIRQLSVFDPTKGLDFSQQLRNLPAYFSPWIWSLVGLTFLVVQMFFLLAKKYAKLSERTFYGFLILFTLLIPFIIIAIFKNFNGRFFWLAFLHYWIISFLLSSLFLIFGKKEGFKGEWYYLFFLLWVASAIYGATERSRIIFLTSQPVAFMAGYGFSLFLRGLKDTNLFEKFGSSLKKIIKIDGGAICERLIFTVILALILFPLINFNIANAKNTANMIGGSPDKFWMENLKFMRENTSYDSVILSWWDYGYWFETIGERAALADGGNPSHYVNKKEDIKMVNYDLADFFTSNNYTEWLPWLKARGVDYVVLDYTMIGKYSAVTQIHNRDNSKFSIMSFMDFAGEIEQNDKRFFRYCFKQGNRCIFGSPKLFIPVKIMGNSIQITEAPILKDITGNIARFNKFCSPDRIIRFNVTKNVVPGCPHLDPVFGIQRIVLVSRNQNGNFMDKDVGATLVKLYLRDGKDMPEFEKVFDNGFVKMWKVNYPEWVNKELESRRGKK